MRTFKNNNNRVVFSRVMTLPARWLASLLFSEAPLLSVGRIRLPVFDRRILALLFGALFVGGCIVPPKPEPQVLEPHELRLLVTINRAQKLALGGRLEEAEGEFRKAIKLAPGRSALHNDLGFVLDSQARTIEAMRSYLKALELDPDNLSAHTNLARALYRMGRLERALDQYQTALVTAERLNSAGAISGDGSFSGRDLASTYQNMAFISATLGLDEQAICYADLARQVGEKMFGSPEYARFLLSLGRVREAKDLLAEVVSQQGSDASLALLLDYGVSLWLAKEDAQAKQIFEQIALGDLSDFETRERLDALSILAKMDGVDSSTLSSLCNSSPVAGQRGHRKTPVAPYWPEFFIREVEKSIGEQCERSGVS